MGKISFQDRFKKLQARRAKFKAEQKPIHKVKEEMPPKPKILKHSKIIRQLMDMPKHPDKELDAEEMFFLKTKDL